MRQNHARDAAATPRSSRLARQGYATSRPSDAAVARCWTSGVADRPAPQVASALGATDPEDQARSVTGRRTADPGHPACPAGTPAVVCRHTAEATPQPAVDRSGRRHRGRAVGGRAGGRRALRSPPRGQHSGGGRPMRRRGRRHRLVRRESAVPVAVPHRRLHQHLGHHRRKTGPERQRHDG